MSRSKEPDDEDQPEQKDATVYAIAASADAGSTQPGGDADAD